MTAVFPNQDDPREKWLRIKEDLTTLPEEIRAILCKDMEKIEVLLQKGTKPNIDKAVALMKKEHCIDDLGVNASLWFCHISIVADFYCYQSEHCFSYTNRDDLETALACIEKAINLKPKESDYYMQKARILFAFNRREEAYACQDQAIKISPHKATHYEEKGFNLYLEHRYEEAIACLDKAIGINPREARYYYQKAKCFEWLKKEKEANFYFKKAKLVGGENMDDVFLSLF